MGNECSGSGGLAEARGQCPQAAAVHGLQGLGPPACLRLASRQETPAACPPRANAFTSQLRLDGKGKMADIL